MNSLCLSLLLLIENLCGQSVTTPAELRIGNVLILPEENSLKIPARVNLTEGIAEFALVHKTGKTHESIFVTDCSAIEINAALKLLDIPETKEIFPIMDEALNPTGGYHPVDPETKRNSRLTIDVTWIDENGQTIVRPLRSFISHQNKQKSLPQLEWIYTGSYFYGERFLAKIEGDLIAIYTANSALVNLLHPDRLDDESWTVLSKKLPPSHLPVTMVLSKQP